MKYSYIAQCAVKHLRSGFKLPYMVMFETTLMCNMFCEYCIFGEEGKFNDLGSRAARERIFRRIDEFCEMGVFALSFSGGEPLLNPNTCDYIARAEDKGMWTSMPTNGLLIRKYADGVARLGMLEVSIDSLNPPRFAKRRGIDCAPRDYRQSRIRTDQAPTLYHADQRRRQSGEPGGPAGVGGIL